MPLVQNNLMQHSMVTPTPDNPLPVRPNEYVSPLDTQPVRIGLIAGEGHLPMRVAESAIQKGIEVVPMCLSWANRGPLKKLTGTSVHTISPGLWEQTFQLLTQEKNSACGVCWQSE